MSTRTALLCLALILGLGALAHADTFYACARANGTLMPQIYLNTMPTCNGNTTLVSWSSGAVALPMPYVESNSAVVAPDEERCVHAMCGPGDRVETGGWQVQGPGGAEGNNVLISLNQAGGGPPNAPTGWSVCAQNISSQPITLLVFANCLN